MTYTFKLSRRLAQSWAATVVAASSLLLSCSSADGPSGPDTPVLPNRIVISPESITLGVGQTTQFGIVPDSSAGWSATGGSVDASGRYTAGAAIGDYRVIATASNGSADTAAVRVTAEAPVLAQVVLSPESASVPAGGSKQFVTVGNSADGSTVSMTPLYAATGGTVSAGGLYTAGGTSGTYRVVATDSVTGRADTSAVTITPPDAILQAVVLTPATISLTLGGIQQFTATGTMSDGTTSPLAVTWGVAGGTISSNGLYTASQTAGSYRLIATETGGTLADTSAIIITAPPPPPTACSGVQVAPGASIQAAVNANPAGTTFCLRAGTHVRQSVIPKSSDRFIGEPGTVLDGQGAAYAFAKGNAPYPSNVTIQSLKVTGYTPPMQSATVDAGGYGTAQGTTGWVIDNNEVSYNGEYGIRIGNSTRITNNKVHHNKRLNIAGNGKNTVIESNEIAFGNYTNSYNTNFEAGGTKFAQCDGLVLRNNYVHDNVGVGLHMDENNINTIIESNRIDRNGSEGIAIEISYKTTIFNNTVTNNGWADPRNRYTYLWNAGIGIHASPNVEVYGNTVTGNYAGIVAIEQPRGTDAAWYGPHVVQNLYVHNNTITQTNLPSGGGLSVGSGVATDIAGNTAIFTSRNNRFVSNTYNTGQNPFPFAWQFGARTKAQWKAYGQDVSGNFTP